MVIRWTTGGVNPCLLFPVIIPLAKTGQQRHPFDWLRIGLWNSHLLMSGPFLWVWEPYIQLLWVDSLSCTLCWPRPAHILWGKPSWTPNCLCSGPRAGSSGMLWSPVNSVVRHSKDGSASVSVDWTKRIVPRSNLLPLLGSKLLCYLPGCRSDKRKAFWLGTRADMFMGMNNCKDFFSPTTLIYLNKKCIHAKSRTEITVCFQF